MCKVSCELRKRLKAVLDEALRNSSTDNSVVIDEIHTIVGAEDRARRTVIWLKPMFSFFRGELLIVEKQSMEHREYRLRKTVP